jgi:tungstate transport system permease protein
MSVLIDGIVHGARLVLTADPDVVGIVALTLEVSVVSVVLSLLLGTPLGIWLSFASGRLRNLLLALVNTGMAAPPVTVGLLVFVLLSRNGPLGAFDLLYTPAAIVIAQTLIGLPVVAGLVYAALSQVPADIALQALGLGASKLDALKLVVREARLGAVAALVAVFGAIISEVGAVMMVGGNIRGETRTLTTAIVTETRMGNFALAFALAIILFLLSFLANLVFTRLQRTGEEVSWWYRSWK